MFAPLAAMAAIFMVQVVACDMVLEPDYVVGLCADNASGNPECGTGFAIEDHKILTARHVVRNADGSYKTGLVVKTTQYYDKEMSGEVVYVSETYDVAVVQVKKHLDEFIPVCDSNLVQLGDKVETHKFSGTSYIETSEGVVSKFYGDIISATASGRPGFSGGPLMWLDREGGEDCAIGVVYGEVISTGRVLASPLTPAFASLVKPTNAGD